MMNPHQGYLDPSAETASPLDQAAAAQKRLAVAV
jgi:hypothetical protein